MNQQLKLYLLIFRIDGNVSKSISPELLHRSISCGVEVCLNRAGHVQVFLGANIACAVSIAYDIFTADAGLLFVLARLLLGH